MDGLPAVKTYPNQKQIVIHRDKVSTNKEEEYYAKINIQSAHKAMKDMNGRDAGGFLLWSYLSLIADGTEWALSSAAVEETCGIKKDAYDRAVAMLIDKGYLVRRSGSNVYDFYQTPQKKEG